MAKSNLANIDWLTVLLFLILVSFGWMNIFSASFNDDAPSILSLSEPYGKQALWIGLSFVMIIFIFSTEQKFFERFSSIIYIVSLLSLIGLFIFGKTISGATSWYVFGPVSIQPSEFAKAATSLALAKYVSDLQTNIKLWKDQIYAFVIILLPALIIVPQPDPGSAIVYAAFLFSLYREGITSLYFLIGFIAVTIFVLTLLVGPQAVIIALFLIGLLLILFSKNKKKLIIPTSGIFITLLFFSLSVNYVFNNIFEQRHRDRFNIVLGKEVDSHGIGYNTNQSEIAIGSGSWLGKGWKQGTQTKGGFVPEQHTDYIFSTVGEEWGFVGSMLVVITFIFLIIRVLFLAERQKSQFNRVYGYSVSGILFIHFLINIGMVTGLLPTVGIPLPFFSYGGSGLWGFTILLFIFIKLDSDRMHT